MPGTMVGAKGRDEFPVEWESSGSTQKITILYTEGYDWGIIKLWKRHRGRAIHSRWRANKNWWKILEEVMLKLSLGEEGGCTSSRELRPHNILYVWDIAVKAGPYEIWKFWNKDNLIWFSLSIAYGQDSMSSLAVLGCSEIREGKRKLKKKAKFRSTSHAGIEVGTDTAWDFNPGLGYHTD